MPERKNMLMSRVVCGKTEKKVVLLCCCTLLKLQQYFKGKCVFATKWIYYGV